jgi:hypothetical protein
MVIGWILSAPLLLIILAITHRDTNMKRPTRMKAPTWVPQTPPESRPEQKENTVFRKM